MRLYRTLSPADVDAHRLRRTLEPSAMHIGGISPRLATPSRWR